MQAHREPAAKKIQALQIAIHNHVLANVLAGRGGPTLRLLRFALRHTPGAARRKFAEVLAVGQREPVV